MRSKPFIGITCSDNVVEGRPVFGLNKNYQWAIEQAGGIPVLLGPTDPSAVPGLLNHVQGVVVIGGDDIHPGEYGQRMAVYPGSRKKRTLMTDRRFRFEAEILRVARQRRLPALGICGGMQMMNVVRGGTMYQDVSLAGVDPRKHVNGKRHDVRALKGSHLAEWLGRRNVNIYSAHHQSVDRLGDGLRMTALSPDGLVEALEDAGNVPHLGVEWHPEVDWQKPAQVRFFKKFVELTRNPRLW